MKQIHIRRAVALVFIVGLLALFPSDSASAATTAISAAQAELRALSNLVDQLSAQEEGLTEDYNYANQKYEDAKAAADKAAAEVAQAQKDLLAARDRLGERLVSIYKSGDIGTLEALLSSDNFSDVLSLLDGLRSIAEEDARLVSEIETYKQQQADAQVRLNADMKQAQEYKAQATAAQQAVLAQLQKAQQALKGKEVQLAQLRKAEAERQAQLAAAERARKLFLATRPGQVISLARQYLGVRYVWAGSSPSGFDCSGLVKYVYAKVGVSLPHSARMMFNMGTPVARAALKPGDLVFFFSPIQHVGIYIGDGNMINATGNRVQINDVWPNSYRGARRVL